MSAEIRPVELCSSAPARRGLSQNARAASRSATLMPTWCTSLATAPASPSARLNPEYPLGIAREHFHLLVARKAGDDLGIGVDDVRVGAEHSVDRPVGAKDDAVDAERLDAAST